jgi:hypothetical protein
MIIVTIRFASKAARESGKSKLSPKEVEKLNEILEETKDLRSEKK